VIQIMARIRLVVARLAPLEELCACQAEDQQPPCPRTETAGRRVDTAVARSMMAWPI
jgi:hypothetical protein